MNTAAKQEASVAKALGSLAYESVFIYPTSNELWTRVQIQNNHITTYDLAQFFSPVDFSIKNDDEDLAGSLLVRNNKLAKVVN
jgi:hypothetical protein